MSAFDDFGINKKSGLICVKPSFEKNRQRLTLGVLRRRLITAFPLKADNVTVP